MKAAILAAGLCLLAPTALAAPAKTDEPELAADLASDCSVDPEPCGHAVTWIRNNTAACIRFDLADKDIVAQVVAWLKKHPKETGTDDNDLVHKAVEGLWPCN